MARRYRKAAGEGGEDGGVTETPAQVNARGNASRLNRIEEIGRGVDSTRAEELVDTDGERTVGAFAGGEFDDSPEARERAALREDELAAQALEEAAEEAEARRLQAEGAGGGDGEEGAPASERDRTAQRSDPSDSDDEKVVDGTRYYRTMVDGAERWLTLKELRGHAATAGEAQRTLQRAQEALQNAATAALTPKADPAAEELGDQDLENVIISAGMGDEEAVRKLATVIKGRPKGTDPAVVDQIVSQRIATQREVDRAEEAEKDLLKHATLAPVFRQRLSEYAAKNPTAKIVEAYATIGKEIRKDFAPMLQPGQGKPPPKIDRKRTIVTPPQSAGRQPRKEDDDREVPVSEQIDQIAKARGQGRAHRVRRS